MILVPILAMFVQTTAFAPSPPVQTRQQQFEAAALAINEGRCADALPILDALQRTGRREPTADALIALRKGTCQIATGDEATGRAAIGTAVAALAGNKEFEEEVRNAQLALVLSHMRAFAYVDAQTEAERALAGLSGAHRIPFLSALAQVAMFDRSDAALRAVDEMRAIAATTPNFESRDLAMIATVRGRVLLNRGDTAGALTELREALRLQGGLGLRVTLRDLLTRSDLSLAAMLAGQLKEGREFLAYTGSARMRNVPFARASVLGVPTCGEESGLKPEDRAVVEVQIATDGTVLSVAPIWSTVPRAETLAFAQAASEWSWRSEDVAAVHPLYREATRVELRCSTASEGPGTVTALWNRTVAWVTSNGWGTIDDGLPTPAGVQAARSALAALPAGDPRRLSSLLTLATSPLVTFKEGDVLLAEAQTIADAHNAPAAARTWFRLSTPSTGRRRFWRDRYTQLLADPIVAQDALSSATVRMAMARRAGDDIAAPLYQAVIDDTRLAEDDPLKVRALLQTAAIQARAGQLDAARASFDRTGLTEQQCALLGVNPVMRSRAFSYPRDVLRWGFEGWVRVEYDVTADGRSERPRAIIAYPPMTFGDTAAGMIANARFETSYRPSGNATACSASQQQFVFAIQR